MRKGSSRITARGWPKRRWPSLAWSAALPLALSAACSTPSVPPPPLTVEHRTAPLARFHPPLPAPIAVPGEVTVAVLTPDVTAHLNAEVLQGTRAPYVLFAMSEPDWLTLARWQQDVLRYLEQLRAVVEFYRAEKDLPRAAVPPAGS